MILKYLLLRKAIRSQKWQPQPPPLRLNAITGLQMARDFAQTVVADELDILNMCHTEPPTTLPAPFQAVLANATRIC